MNIQTETTQKDWEDFWYSPEKFGDWGHPESEQSPDPESEQQEHPESEYQQHPESA